MKRGMNGNGGYRNDSDRYTNLNESNHSVNKPNICSKNEFSYWIHFHLFVVLRAIHVF